MVYNVIIFLIVYLICSINPAIEICKRKEGTDIRKLGSGNAGTTNAIRVLGLFWGILTFILDILKVVVAYGIIYLIGNIFKQDIGETFKSIFIVSAVIGHCFPVYYLFRGGKGIVVTLVIALILNYQIAIVCIIAALVIIIVTKTVSIGSLSGIILFTIMTLVMMPQYILPVLLIASICVLKHRKNIVRIVNNEENKLF